MGATWEAEGNASIPPGRTALVSSVPVDTVPQGATPGAGERGADSSAPLRGVRAEGPPNTACTRRVGLVAFSGSARGSRLVTSRRVPSCRSPAGDARRRAAWGMTLADGSSLGSQVA
jgi:hypothetical protein